VDVKGIAFLNNGTRGKMNLGIYKRMRKIIAVIILTNSMLIMAYAQIGEVVRQFSQSDEMRHGYVGVCAIEVSSNNQIFGWNEDILLTPASTLKAVTTATALGILGAEYQFPTWLEHSGSVSSDGVLKGNLYIRGSGDPSLGSPEQEGVLSFDQLMDYWGEAILAAGIRRIEGSIIGDASVMAGEELGRDWEWQDIGNYYGGGVWGLNIHENLYVLSFQQHPEVGKAPSILGSRPEVSGLEFVNQVVSGAAQSGDQAYIFGGPYSYIRHVRGSIPAGRNEFSIKGAIPDPPLFAAQHLRKELISRGVTISGEARGKYFAAGDSFLDVEREMIAVHYSPPLREIVRRANHESVNVYCEALLRMIGMHRGGDGSMQSGIDNLRSFWDDRGLALAGAIFKDGSGLSRGNSLSARQLARMLAKIGRDQSIFEPFFASLPIAGQSGTLKKVLSGTPAEGKVVAKSGSMGRVRAYAGYIRTRSGKQLAFAIMADRFVGENWLVQRELERILLELYQL